MGIKITKNRIQLSGSDANNFFQNLKEGLRKSESEELEKFNQEYKVGDKVIVLDDQGKEFLDEIKNEATLMGGHTNMAWLKENGSYLMKRVIRKEASNG